MMNGTMRHEILRNVRCSRSLAINSSLETGEHTLVVGVVSSAFLAYSSAPLGSCCCFGPKTATRLSKFATFAFKKPTKIAAKLHLVRASSLSECARGHPNFVPEGGREVGLVVKAQAGTNLGQ